MELNVFKLQKKSMEFDDIKYSTLNWVGDFSLEEVKFDHNEELMSFMYESFCMEYELEYDTFVFDDQRDNPLHASILASISSLPSLSHQAPPSVPSSSSLELNPLLNILKYVFLGPDESFPVIIANDLNSNQETQVLDLFRENKEVLRWTLGNIRGISPTIKQHRIDLSLSG